MPIRFAINGLGRVGRALLRIAHDRDDLELAAVNDVVPAPLLARLVARDTVHGPFSATVEAVQGGIAVDGRTIPVFQQPDPAAVDWSREGVEVVVEATGRFLRRTAAAGHLGGTVRWVVLSANPDPADPADATICLGVNDGDGGVFDPAR
ncbi:MAG TPA: glyceraldehyde 3-phosphate dehydrogenase NAD-binding domain-containing protein, partial [Thermoanaerobaculia bacterium]|nr:glyceraldehyde 3-phosphate dehydrogenase NAD-binding domain-containing protein [Thermoanaerobaculia bacterium]